MKRAATKSAEAPAVQGVQVTISQLRRCNEAQSEVIAVLEDYIRTSAGIGFEDDDSLTGYGNGYILELEYLQARLEKLEGVIESFEKYERIAAASLGATMDIDFS
jgi:hypothetical protein